MLIITGGFAESGFRIAKKLEVIKRKVPTVVGLTAKFVYLVDCPITLSSKVQQVLGSLLDIEEPFFCREYEPSPKELIVIPRLGTVSPWSTKATEIFQRCNLDYIRRVERGIIWSFASSKDISSQEIAPYLFDPLVESVIFQKGRLGEIFHSETPRSLRTIKITQAGLGELREINRELSLALTDQEMEYLLFTYRMLKREPTDAELMMFAQVNSEHCRHKLFNASWEIDGMRESHSMLDMIRSTHARTPEGTIVAYTDNAAVLKGFDQTWFLPDEKTREYGYLDEPVHIIAKVETHNHPTGISPRPGAATGSGGEIRDEGATGRGGWPKAGITGFSVSNLNLPGGKRAWENEISHPTRLAKPLEIMIEAPIGAASFNNEFGRPNIGGYFRTLEVSDQSLSLNARRGYHKPIMLAGGLGNIRAAHVEKFDVPDGALLIVLGGPGMLIGLGGGAASSLESGVNREELDFASVQRGNPEMQRRCQEVINACIALGEENPILSIHDVGAGGLCNAVPELVDSSNRGGVINLEDIPTDDPGMSPMETWCNEAQERYVLAISKKMLPQFENICHRESCLYSIVGSAISERNLIVREGAKSSTGKSGRVGRKQDPINVDMDFLFTDRFKIEKRCDRNAPHSIPLDLSFIDLDEAIDRVLQFPAVSDKSFLINIGDRSVGGRVVRDPMVGPWQVPVADVGVTSSSFGGITGECIAIGERAPIALIDPIAGSQMALAESITNISAASVPKLAAVKLSANWMACADCVNEQAALYDTVHTIAMELCPKLGLSIPVGKDSLSMSSRWSEGSEELEVISPITLIVTAYAGITDIHRVWTPALHRRGIDSILMFVDLAEGKTRLGGSTLAQVFSQVGDEPPNVESPEIIKKFFKATRELMNKDMVLAYHDRSDGGLITTLLEMAFAGRVGLEVDIGDKDPLDFLFNEELGAVFEIEAEKLNSVLDVLKRHDLYDWSSTIGSVSGRHNDIVIQAKGAILFRKPRIELHRRWSETSWRIQSLRDEPGCAEQEYNRLLDERDPGLNSFIPEEHAARLPTVRAGQGLKPKICVLREQGVNGHLEMAYAFDLVGFSARDVTMTDLVSGRNTLAEFDGIVACGGFSFGDVLGAGLGWAKSILHSSNLRDQFREFFDRYNTFTLGVCNGCQMLSGLRELIPGSEHWPYFIRNRSEQFESRLLMVEILKSRSILLSGLEGATLPIVIAHGEGQVNFPLTKNIDCLREQEQISMRYVDNYRLPTQTYPFNPNGSVDGLTGFCNQDGRVTIMMPHPERVVRSVNCSWHPEGWGEFSPWLKVFENARNYCE